MKTQDESLEALEIDLGLPKGFCTRLIEEDDWSFVIKLHALLENALSELITRALQRKELSDIFSRLEMSNTKTGKIAFVQALRLLPAGHILFVRKLSELRNAIAHKIQNTSINLVEYFKAETAKLQPNARRRIGDLWGFGIRVTGEKYASEKLARHFLDIGGNLAHPLPTTLPKGSTLGRALMLILIPKLVICWSALQILDAISLCNWYGPQMWSFLLECGDRKDCEDWVHEVFAKAKIGDPGLPERIAQKFERLHPGVRIRRDEDGQPDLESMAAAFRIEQKRILDQI